MKRITLCMFAILILVVLGSGCGHGLWFPETEFSRSSDEWGSRVAYDIDEDGCADYFNYLDPDGRRKIIAFDYNADGEPDSFVNLDEIEPSRCRHLVIILDGFPYDLVKDYYDKGNLRFFHPPSRVVAPFPSLTDLCIGEALDHISSPAYESKYFDRRRQKMASANWDYLMLKNEPWVSEMDYRGPILLDTVSYISPWQVMKTHVSQAHSMFMQRDRKELITYYVASAGMGTTNGDEGRIRCLALIERMVEQVICETRGMVKITIFADHGHASKPFRSPELDPYLEQRGWNVTSRLKNDSDVIHIKFGFLTYTAMLTRNAPKLTADLVANDKVELAAYMLPGNAVCVKSAAGEAIIRKKNGRYSYEQSTGDPLMLGKIIKQLRANGKIDAEGFIDDKALFDATVMHYYPDPLRRLWRAFYGIVENVPDVLACLKDDYACGAYGFGVFLKKASTHGGLNYVNSVTFIMSTAGPLPAAMRTDEIPVNLSKLFNRPFPYRR